MNQRTETEENADVDGLNWSSSQRIFATMVILFYLLILIAGPLSNPIASERFSKPIARAVSPFHHAMFLGHGYRFFGPDPGPSHRVVFKIKKPDGTVVEGHFPDREKHSPRLLYHRWFMLSETVFEEHHFTPDDVGFAEVQKMIASEIQAMRDAGEFSIVKQLEKKQSTQERQYNLARARIEQMVNAIADHLLQKNDGETIELFIQERSIASPLDVIAGIDLEDPRFLSPLIPIGPGLEELPVAETPSKIEAGEKLESTENELVFPRAVGGGTSE